MSGFDNEYPSNSHKSKEQDPVETKIVEKVVTGSVIRKKKPLGQRMSSFFIAEDPSSVGQYLLTEVLLPNLKDMALDLITQGAERTFYGTVRSRPRSSVFRTVGSTSSGFTNYNRASQPVRTSRPDREAPRAGVAKTRSRMDVDRIVLETRPEAVEVVEGLANLITKYGTASIGDLYGLIGETGTHTDEKWGWNNIEGSDIQRTSEGYLIVLPPAEPIE